MKITPKHYAHISHALDAIKPIIVEMIPAYKAVGHSDKRIRWDAARLAGLIPFICDNVYQYANDTHVDTALRQYFNKLGV